MTFTVTSTLANPDFEAGDSGWIDFYTGNSWTISNLPSEAFQGGWIAKGTSADFGTTSGEMINTSAAPVTVGQSVSAACRVRGNGGDGNIGAIFLEWQDSSHTRISKVQGNSSNYGSHGVWEISSVTSVAPAGAVYVALGIWNNIVTHGDVSADSVSWNIVNDRTAVLSSPVDGTVYTEGDAVLLAVTLGGTAPAVTKVEYKESTTVLATTTTPNYSYNLTDLSVGDHAVYAVVTLSDGTTITTDRYKH